MDAQDQQLQTLLAQLNSNDREKRQEAVEALVALGDRRAIEPLIALLTDYSMLGAACYALVKFGDERAIQPLADVLRRASYGHHYIKAGLALTQFGDPGFAALIELLQSPLERAASYAASALGASQDERAKAPLMAAAKSREISEDVRWHAVTALGDLQDVQVSAFLQQIMNDPTETSYIRSGAAQTFGLTGPGSIQNLLGVLPDAALRDGAAAGLGLVGPAALPSLTEALNDQDSGTRAGAAAALGWVASSGMLSGRGSDRYTVNLEPIDPLLQALTDPSAEVREKAINGLLNATLSLQIYGMLFRRTPNLPPEIAQMQQQQAPLDREKVLEPVVKALQEDSSASVRSTAAMVVGQLGIKDSRATSPLAQARDSDSDENVRFRANEALLMLNNSEWGA